MKQPIAGGITVTVLGIAAQLPATAYYDNEKVWAITALGVPGINIVPALSEQQLAHLHTTFTQEKQNDQA